jgi:CRISPR-associated endonuclease/helicase Cas3
MRRFYAHSTHRIDKEDWQPLAEHLTDVGRRAREAADVFGAGALAEVAGLLHDLGKYTDGFQARLEGKAPRLDHATHGARIAQARYGPLGTLLAYAIAGHHAGLADGMGSDTGRTSLQDRLKATLPKLLPQWERELSLPHGALPVPSGYTARPERAGMQLTVLTRMLFSALVDADYCDTDGFYRRIKGRPLRDAGPPPPTLADLRGRLDAHLVALPTSSKGGEVNALRAEILSHVRTRSSEAPGLFSLTVPTGGGKTLASMAFALDHALAHGLRRVIYVIPFTSIIEQNAAVFRNAFGNLGDTAVLEHHSALDDRPERPAKDDDLQAPEARRKLDVAMENWDAPIVVTSAVQFFESLFADRPARCRKLHNIAGSVVVLDEAQTLPLHLLRPCVAALDELALNYRTSVVLCTATQPALGCEDGFDGGFERVRELAPDLPALYRRLERVSVRHIGEQSDDDLAAHMREREQVLCIVNNRGHARALYEAIADAQGARHLTTLMHAHHRSTVLDEVRMQLKAGQPCRLVSTSLIEAGVDVDFPAVLRAETGLDAIAQAAGRCNREGRRPREASEVLVFTPVGWAPPPELKRYAEVFRDIARRHQADLLGLDAVRDYFLELYWRKGDAGLDQKQLMALLDRSKRPDMLPFATLAKQFRMIENRMRPVIAPFDVDAEGRVGESPRAMDALRRLVCREPGDQGPSVGQLARVLQRYLVQLPAEGYYALRSTGAVQLVEENRYGEQFAQLMVRDQYHPRFGVYWDDPMFIAAENLCI